MSQAPVEKLSPEKALIFRVTRIDNVPWALAHGLCASQHPKQDPGFVSIGLEGLIDARKRRNVPVEPGGTLADYVPFYFTPYSPMLYNVVTGRNVVRQPREQLAVLVSSLHRVAELGCRFVVSDRHAYLNNARFINRVDQLIDWVPWALLRSRDFSHDPENPEKTERYQAEALVHWSLPAEALLGVVVYNEASRAQVLEQVDSLGLSIRVLAQPGWFF